MSRTHTLETKTLVEAMESRAKEYQTLREQFETLKTAFQDIVNLDDFKGRTAESVKGFYRAQIDVVDAWIDFIDLQEAFFKGIKGIASDEGLDEGTVVHLPFLDMDLKNSETRARQMVDDQEQALRDIFSGIKDIISLEPYSTRRFDRYIDEVTDKRKQTKEKVESFDQFLVEHYNQSVYHENIIAGLISELYKASSQGGEVNPLQFHEDTYKNSEIHDAKEEAKQITAEYISWQDSLEKARELENRPWYEKTWDTVCTFTGELTGYYDMKRATTGIDPVTGEELTAGQRTTAAALAAAGFIPFVGWAGRAAKGGHAIYKTSKTFKAADSALDAYRTTEAFDILRKTEYGLYGLASANGFSEYITGKDMFGNPISEEEKQAGFERALALLPIKKVPTTTVLGAKNGHKVVNKGTGNITRSPKTAEQLISERTKGLDLSPHPIQQKQLSAKKMKELSAKIENRSITKAEYEQYMWNKRFAKRRDRGVVEFWKQERLRILNGDTPTRNWTSEQIEDILNKKRPKFNGQTLQGHHTYSASKYPHLANKNEVIYPVTFKEHFYGWHGGNYKNSLPGKPINEIKEF